MNNPSRFENYPKNIDINPKTRDARIILQAAHKSASSLLKIFEYKDRINSEVKDDLLRAMLIFSTAGLDAVIKQLINDCLSVIVEKDNRTQSQFAKYIERRLKYKDPIDYAFTARIISSKNSRKAMIEEWVKDLTSGSLQSFEELSKIQENFNIPTSDVIKNQQILKDIFITRNQISHEMDIDLESGTGRNQHPRKMELMKTYTQEIFNICIKFIEKVEEKLVLDDLDLHESENGFYISA